MVSSVEKLNTKLWDEYVEECKKEFIKHHPEFEAMPLSYNKIIYEAAKFYLKG